MDAIRCLVDRIKKRSAHSEALFLGGVFAYDFIATFEQLIEVPDGENTTPDYVFYVAETLMIHDHQTQQGEILGSIFGGLYSDESELRITQRITELQGLCDNFIAPINQQITIDAKVSVDVSDAEYCAIVEQLKNQYC